MSFTRCILFHLDIHLLQGLAIPPDLLLGHNLKILNLPIRRYDGLIFLPPQIYKLLSQDAMKALKAYNTETINRFHERKVHNTEIVETPQDDPPGPPVPENDLPDLPESDLDIPDDPILDFVNSQCHSSEDLDQDLQASQAYQVASPQDSTMTPERSINHHFTYHVAQASQAKHGSLVDDVSTAQVNALTLKIRVELYSFSLYTLYLYVYMSTYLAGLVNDVRMHYPDTF